MKILVLGAGMQGKTIALDLANRFEVTSADLSEEALGRVKARNANIDTVVCNVTDERELSELVERFDIVVNAVPGFLGFKTLETLIRTGKKIVDISYMPENSLDLNELAKSYNTTVISDCGVAPGYPNLILGYWNERTKINEFRYVVGGLPKQRSWPFNYKAPFSPIDVLEEYTRPVYIRVNNKVLTVPPLSGLELFDFDSVGTLEGFYTDGLRTLNQTIKNVPTMYEKTLRYPGHAEYIQVLKSSGFFSNTPISVKGTSIVPMEFTSKILIDVWKFKDQEPDVCVLRVELDCEKNGENVTLRYDLYDEYCNQTDCSSMSRTTGYHACAAVNLLADGLWSEKGVFPPELIGVKEECYNYILDYVAARRVIFHKTEIRQETGN